MGYDLEKISHALDKFYFAPTVWIIIFANISFNFQIQDNNTVLI